MPKYIRRSKSSSSRTDSLRDALLRDLEREGQQLLKKLLSQFTSDLEKEGARTLQSLFAGSGKNSGGGGAPGLDSAAQLIGTLISYAVSRPKTSSSTRESDRSRDEASRFRVSRSQAMLEASAELAKSERNL